MDWLRLYTDMPNDPKIGTLSDTQFRTWVELLCLAGKADADGCTGMTVAEASWALRRNITDDLKELNGGRGLVIVGDDGKIKICKWSKRQYKGDSAAERMRRYRQNKKGDSPVTSPVTSPLRHGDGIEQNREEQNREEDKPLSAPAQPEPDDAAPLPPIKPPPYQRICNTMNTVLRTNYKATENFKKLVRARYQDGFTEADFEAVCKAQLEAWKDDEKMRKFLRPDTLFSPKMNAYLGAAQQTAAENDDRSEFLRLREEYLQREAANGC